MMNNLRTYFENWSRALWSLPSLLAEQGGFAIAIQGASQPARQYREDERLVERARYGDHSAFRQLFECYSPLVYRVAYRMLGHQEDAADVTQDVFVRAYERLGTLQHGLAFQAWVTRLTVNMVRDRRRRRQLETTPLDVAPADQDGAPAWELPSTDPPLDQELLKHELSQHVQAALLHLSPEHRAVIILHHLEHLPVEEIILTLQVPAVTIKSRLARARAELRRRLEEYVTSEDDDRG